MLAKINWRHPIQIKGKLFNYALSDIVVLVLFLAHMSQDHHI